MASIEDLKNALKETLEARGVLGDLKAKIRAEIFSALDDREPSRPRLSQENVLINELIREYLEYNGYNHTLSVLVAESGQPAQSPFDRAFISRELKISETMESKSVPLLYGILRGLRPIVAEERNIEVSSTMPPKKEVIFADPQPFSFTKTN
ncbi:unnamed protein product [Blepharisma stoltei]|uniref:Centrosomal protein 20 n=1 Tax=Blepharisma stoltei TaxID=1481888 RepID=A0AAU9IYG0_9CILI|nr:unnamed protein product [Blepharisma stoltei]